MDITLLFSSSSICALVYSFVSDISISCLEYRDIKCFFGVPIG